MFLDRTGAFNVGVNINIQVKLKWISTVDNKNKTESQNPEHQHNNENKLPFSVLQYWVQFTKSFVFLCRSLSLYLLYLSCNLSILHACCLRDRP